MMRPSQAKTDCDKVTERSERWPWKMLSQSAPKERQAGVMEGILRKPGKNTVQAGSGSHTRVRKNDL